MRKNDENNFPTKEEQNSSEYVNLNELTEERENITLRNEFSDTKEFDDNNDITENQTNPSPKNKLKINHIFTTITTSFVALTVASIIGFTSLINVTLNASFTSLVVEDGAIKYEINVSNHTEDEEIKIYLYDSNNNLINESLVDIDVDNNNFYGQIDVDFQQLIENDENVQFVDDIPTFVYYAELKGTVGLDVERTFDRYELDVQIRTSTFNEVTGYCNCSRDGYFYFTMDFDDDLGIFSNFNVYIMDEKENIFTCIFTENLHDEQKIYVRNAYGTKARLIIEYTVSEEEIMIDKEIII